MRPSEITKEPEAAAYRPDPGTQSRRKALVENSLCFWNQTGSN